MQNHRNDVIFAIIDDGNFVHGRFSIYMSEFFVMILLLQKLRGDMFRKIKTLITDIILIALCVCRSISHLCPFSGNPNYYSRQSF